MIENVISIIHYLSEDCLLILICSEVWKNKVLSDSFERQYRDLCLGAKALSQVHGI